MVQNEFKPFGEKVDAKDLAVDIRRRVVKDSDLSDVVDELMGYFHLFSKNFDFYYTGETDESRISGIHFRNAIAFGSPVGGSRADYFASHVSNALREITIWRKPVIRMAKIASYFMDNANKDLREYNDMYTFFAIVSCNKYGHMGFKMKMSLYEDKIRAIYLGAMGLEGVSYLEMFLYRTFLILNGVKFTGLELLSTVKYVGFRANATYEFVFSKSHLVDKLSKDAYLTKQEVMDRLESFALLGVEMPLGENINGVFIIE